MFAMTERAHRSNVRGIRTEATFDLSAQVSILPGVLAVLGSGPVHSGPSFLPSPPSPLLCVLSGERVLRFRRNA